MRYIDIGAAVANIPQNVLDGLQRADVAMQGKTDLQKQTSARRGNARWTAVRPHFDAISHGKCWYTESKSAGSLHDIDHFRPKAKVLNGDGTVKHWYWFLVFNPTNYRLSCQISNRPNQNPVLGNLGGKGDNFPLVHDGQHASDSAAVVYEQPVMLDPCCEVDTELLVFEPDGRPVVSAVHKTDVAASFRVEQSKLLLNLDFPSFNEAREQLYNRIRDLVNRGDSYGEGNPALQDVKDDLRRLIQPEAEYSRAAECYVRCFRDRGWVEDLLV